jgi:beta-galactosidase
MLQQLWAYYEPLYRRNIGIDFVHPGADLSSYKVVLVPNLYMVCDNDGLPQRLEKFVVDGGTLVMSFFSGIVDENDHVGLGGYPAAFRKVLGLRVEEFDPYVPGQTNTIRLTESGTSHPCDLWSDVIDLEGAEALGVYGDDFYAGKPAMTRYKFGQGYSYYLGTRPEAGLLENLLVDVCGAAGVTALPGVPEGVEVVARQGETGRYLFVLNHNNSAVEIELPYEAVNLLGKGERANRFTLGAYDVLLLTAQS